MNNTAVNVCNGIFYDSGGSGANYGNNQNFTKTFCSPTAGQCVQLVFTSFSVSNNDFLYVYDGNSVAAPLIGQYNNTLYASCYLTCQQRLPDGPFYLQCVGQLHRLAGRAKLRTLPHTTGRRYLYASNSRTAEYLRWHQW